MASLDEFSREQVILSALRTSGRVAVNDLSARFGVSSVTVRKDLDALERRSLLRRVRGGAVSLGASDEGSFEARFTDSRDRKQAIAKAAAAAVRDGDVIAIDSSTTAFYLAQELVERRGLVVVTNGLRLATLLMVCSVITAKALVAEVSLVPAVLLSVAVGGVLGLLNGVLIAYGRVHAIIITFGTANIFLWLSLKLFNSTTVNNIPDTLAPLGNGAAGRTLGVPNSFLITVVLVAIAWIYLRHTAGGRHFYAIGGDQLAAQLAGVKVRQRVLTAYLLTGLLVGLAS